MDSGMSSRPAHHIYRLGGGGAAVPGLQDGTTDYQVVCALANGGCRIGNALLIVDALSAPGYRG